MGRADESEGAIQFSYPEVAAIVAEARAAGKVATAHAHPEEAIRNSVRAGVRSIEHGTHLTEELAGMMRDQGTFLVPTFAIYRGLASAGRWPELAPRAQHVFDVKVRTFAAAVERGVRWGIGTDAGSFFPPTLIADEIEIIAGLGFSPWEVISQATAGNADLLVRLRVKDTEHLRALIFNGVWNVPGLERTETCICLSGSHRAPFEPKFAEALVGWAQKPEVAPASASLSQQSAEAG